MRGIRKFWQSKAYDLEYCNSKFNHIPRLVNQIIAIRSMNSICFIYFLLKSLTVTFAIYNIGLP